MRLGLTAMVLFAMATHAMAESTPRQDALVASYFSIWDDNRRVTLDTVEKLYASRLIYYGHAMTREGLLRDKLNFIRRWPQRRYAVEPGSASKRCDTAEEHCVITANLVWRTSGAGGTRAGRSRVSLTLAREDGALKIVREGGITLGQ